MRDDALKRTAAQTLESGGATYPLLRGFPPPETIRKAYDDADLSRAVEAYRFFFPTVSGHAIFTGGTAVGLRENQIFGLLDTQPRHRIFTANSDTPYGPMLLDLSIGPIAIELPPGALIVVAMDVHQRWVADMGVPGPDEGRGGKHLLLPPECPGAIPGGFYVWKSTTSRLTVGVRSIPVHGDVKAAIDLMRRIQVRPLRPPPGWAEPKWVDLTAMPQDTTPLEWENNIQFWRVLHEVIDREPPFPAYRAFYGELAALGIVKGQRFAPDERMTRILEQAAVIGNAQMRVQAFADRRPDRVVWPDRKWEWVGLRPEGADFELKSHLDLDAREVWFYQAIGASPAMFRRKEGSGSLYWLGLRDSAGAYLDGAESYSLSVPLPVPAKLFWSVTVYDAETRSEIQTEQGKAALRSMFELQSSEQDRSIELYFGPEAPSGKRDRWIQTLPGRGFFTYFRLYGPQQPAFDGSWKPGDFQVMR